MGRYIRRAGQGCRRAGVHFFMIKLSETESMRVMSCSGICAQVQYGAARLAFASEHQNQQVHYWRPVLFTDENKFTLSTRDRCERVWRCCGECYAVCKIFQHEWFGSGSVMVCGGISLECCTDLHVLANSTFTAVIYRDEILRDAVRSYAGAVALGSSWSRTMTDSCVQSEQAVSG